MVKAGHIVGNISRLINLFISNSPTFVVSGAALVALAALNVTFDASTAVWGSRFDTSLGTLLVEESGRADAADNTGKSSKSPDSGIGGAATGRSRDLSRSGMQASYVPKSLRATRKWRSG
jgi:hypothetical protein